MPVNRRILKYLNVGIFLFPQKKRCKEIITHAKSVELINLVFKSYSMCDLKWSKHTEIQHWWRVVASAVVSDQIDFSLPLLLLNSQLGPAVAVSTETAEEDQHCPQEPEPCRKQEMSGHHDKENKQNKENVTFRSVSWISSSFSKFCFLSKDSLSFQAHQVTNSPTHTLFKFSVCASEPIIKQLS